MENPIPEYIYKDIRSSIGGGEVCEIQMVTEVKTGKTELIISKEIRERYPVEDYEKVMRLFEAITGGGGRTVLTLNDFK